MRGPISPWSSRSNNARLRLSSRQRARALSAEQSRITRSPSTRSMSRAADRMVDAAAFRIRLGQDDPVAGDLVDRADMLVVVADDFHMLADLAEQAALLRRAVAPAREVVSRTSTDSRGGSRHSRGRARSCGARATNGSAGRSRASGPTCRACRRGWCCDTGRDPIRCVVAVAIAPVAAAARAAHLLASDHSRRPSGDSRRCAGLPADCGFRRASRDYSRARSTATRCRDSARPGRPAVIPRRRRGRDLRRGRSHGHSRGPSLSAFRLAAPLPSSLPGLPRRRCVRCVVAEPGCDLVAGALEKAAVSSASSA